MEENRRNETLAAEGNEFPFVPTAKYFRYPRVVEDITHLVKTLHACNFEVRSMPYNTRMALLRKIEGDYFALYEYADFILSDEKDFPGEIQYNRLFSAALKESNYIKVQEGKYHDFIVTAPPLGDRFMEQGDYTIYMLTSNAIKALCDRDRRYFRPENLCVIVKQYCHCEEVTMGTVENREIHVITDTVVQYMGLDDKMWLVDFCYIWCDSDEPRTEIIVTDKKNVKQYRKVCEELYEKGADNQSDNRARLKKERLNQCLKDISSMFAEFGDRGPEFPCGHLDQKSCLFFTTLVRSLATLITLLREPYINGIAHIFSRLYTVKVKSKVRWHTGEKNDGEFNYDYKLSHLCTAGNNELTIKTASPYTVKVENGRDLCMEQQQLIRDTAARYHSEHPLSLDRDGDVVVEIDRYTDRDRNDYADNDNINTMFLSDNYGRRAKVIYVKTVKVDKLPENYDCVIRIIPQEKANILDDPLAEQPRQNDSNGR